MSSIRATRSMSRTLAQTAASAPSTPIKKRKSADDMVPSATPTARKKARPAAEPESPSKPLPEKASTSVVVNKDNASGPSVSGDEDAIPASLTFSLQAAKDHLISADSRFANLFANIRCKPFEEIEAVKPFRTLCSSILGQQISWKAARSIKHKFIRLFDETIPETLPSLSEKQIDFFPSPSQVVKMDAATLRTAGLSGRKAEYVLDLAGRFADGRLSASKLATATDEEVSSMLLDVRGIGPWTVQMFSIFSLRRPDILPCGDLGVQKGLLRWVLASHSPEDAKKIKVAAFRLPGNEEVEDSGAPATPAVPPTPSQLKTDDAKDDTERGGPSSSLLPAPHNPLNPPATPYLKRSAGGSTAPPFTPSPPSFELSTPLPLPDGLTVSALKSRLAGKKVKKGMYFTPEEMDHLTAPWAPYRSIGVWYLWSIIDSDATS